jgi:hypothetical protein
MRYCSTLSQSSNSGPLGVCSDSFPGTKLTCMQLTARDAAPAWQRHAATRCEAPWAWSHADSPLPCHAAEVVTTLAAGQQGVTWPVTLRFNELLVSGRRVQNVRSVYACGQPAHARTTGACSTRSRTGSCRLPLRQWRSAPCSGNGPLESLC